MNNELTQWFNQQPFFTKWICVFSLIIPVILKFRLMTPHYFVFYWPYIIKNFQVNLNLPLCINSKDNFRFGGRLLVL